MVGHFKCHQMVSSHLSVRFLAGLNCKLDQTFTIGKVWLHEAIENATVYVNNYSKQLRKTLQIRFSPPNQAPITNVLLTDTCTSALMDYHFRKRNNFSLYQDLTDVILGVCGLCVCVCVCVLEVSLVIFYFSFTHIRSCAVVSVVTSFFFFFTPLY